MPSASTMPLPRSLPVVGSLFEINGAAPIQSLTRLAARLGPLYRLTILGQSTLVLGGQALVDEVCDEARFGKLVHTALQNLRPALGDGLFTAHTHEANWTLAHRILMPAFGPLGIRGMFGKMTDIARQMFDRWDRFGPDAAIDVSDAMTRLTLDTLALCAFDFRFNSFYREAMHPFVDAMVGTLVEASARERRPAFVSRAMLATRRRFERDVAAMHDLADALLADRRASGRVGERDDLLDAMLTGGDPETGEKLSDENIRFQLVNFLIAGHETTSGLLSFAVHMLLEHPDVLRDARAAVDEALGGREPTVDDLPKLRGVERILMETLRLWPTAPGFAVTPHAPTLLAGEHPVAPGDEILVLLPALHRDPAVWGEDAEAFRPERFADDAASRLPPNSWKPFGNGQRACIGRGFAMQEAQLVIAMLLQRFDVEAADPAYVLQVTETLTLKPEGLRIRARPRAWRPLEAQPAPESPASLRVAAEASVDGAEGTPLLVLHGGNSGSSLSIARRIATQAAARGYAPRLSAMDAAVDALPAHGGIVVVTASYEGQPADNARRFVAWLDALPHGALDGRRFAVLGFGNRQWARTYQAIPRRVDAALEDAGGERLLPRGEADAAGDFVGDADGWVERLWEALAGAFGEPVVASAPDRRPPRVETLPPLRAGAGAIAHCVANVALTAATVPPGEAKRHVEFELPDGMAYRAGDHLAVLPANPPETVARALRRLGADPEARIVVRDDPAGTVGLPTDEPITVRALLERHLELQRSATPEQIAFFAARADDPRDRAAARALLDDAGHGAATARLGTLTLLERLPSSRVTAGDLPGLLPLLAPRRYSISSSPLVNPSRCSLTVAVLDEGATSGDARHIGVASNHVARLPEHAPVAVEVQPGSPGFHLPDDPLVPIVMICAGSGVAPFRGFVQERAIRRRRGEVVGPALLFFGCRHPDRDWLYRDEFAAWEGEGVVDVRPAFSRAPVDGVRHVQDRVRADAWEVALLVRAGARVYVCGDAYAMLPGVEAALADICAGTLGRSSPVARRWARRFLVGRGRYAIDAFA